MMGVKTATAGRPASTRSDGTEPWDERPQADATINDHNEASGGNKPNLDNQSTMRRDMPYGYSEQELEDGDLPTLSLSQKPPSSTRLASPSRFELKKQREFWKQLDSPSSNSRDEEGPDDEMGAYRAEMRESKGVYKKKHKTKVLRRRESDYSDDDSRDSKEYVEEDNEDTNFCDSTLQAMTTICGDAGLAEMCSGAPDKDNNESSSEDIKPRKAKNLNLLNARDEGESVDEHTAIEVEYVEPPQDSSGMEQERPENWSPTRKNAYLAALARKAKEDFEKSQGKNGSSSMARRVQSNSTAELANSPEDVYNSLNAAEKRKFLRLINSGVSPSESAQRVRIERSAAVAIAAAGSKSKDGKNSKKGKLFSKFWKRSGKKDPPKDAPPSSAITSASVGAASVETAVAVATEGPVAQEGSALAATPPQDKPRDPEGFPVVESEKRTVPQEEKKDDDPRQVAGQPASVQQTLSLDDESTFEGLSPNPSQQSQESVTVDSTPQLATSASRSKSADRSINSSRVASEADAAVATSFASSEREGAEISKEAAFLQASSTPGNTSGSTQGNGDAQSDEFARSGINYYDAVRRQLSESDDETNFSNVTGTSKSKSKRASRLGPLLHGPKLQGFSKLSMSESPTTTPAANRQATTVTPDTAVASEWSHQERNGLVTPDTTGRSVDRDLGEFSVQDEKKTEIESPEAEKTYSTPAVTPEQTHANDSYPLIDEEEVLGRVEKDLLRPVIKFSSPVPTSLESAFEQKASPLTDKSPQEKSGATSDPSQEELDLNMKQYLNSTEVYSQSGHQEYVNDNISIVSGTTAETSLYGAGSVFTQNTNLTQSSRARRPGAAKKRLEKAKEAERQASKKMGWHESIRAAAQTQNREWKPEEGWVDYQAPSEDVVPNDLNDSDAPSEKIHLNLQVSKHSKMPEESATASKIKPEVQVQTLTTTNQPEVIHEISPPPAKQTSISHESTPSLNLDEMSVEQSVAHSVDHFMQSVAASSPVRPARKRAVASPMRTPRHTTSPSKRSGWVDSMQAATANIVDDNQSWDPMTGWANINIDAARSPENLNRHDFASPSARYGQNTIEERQNELSVRSSSESPLNHQATEHYTSNNQTSPSREPANARAEEKSDQVVMSLPPREPTQKRDLAVQDKYHDSKSPQRQTDYGPKFSNGKKVDQDTSEEVQGESSNMTPVNVVREKVGEDDFNWFPQTRRGSSTAWTDNEGPQSAQKSVDTSMSSRRSRGPVDVDEADMIPDDSDEDASVQWGGVVFETGSPARTRAVDKAETPLQSGSSVTSLSSFKLNASRRDTSPIRARPFSAASASPPRVTSQPPATATASPPKAYDATKSRIGAFPARVKSLGTGISPMDQSGENQVELGAEDDDESANSSTVRRRLQEWEGRAPRYPQDYNGDAARLNSSTAEWKAFLGKQVHAESAVGIGAPKYVGDRQSDSIFDLSVTGENTSVGSPSRNSTVGLNRLDLEADQYAKAYDANNAPSVVNSDFSDGNEINKGFLGRLASCAAPMVPKRLQDSSADAMAHLAFLRTNNQDSKGRFVPPHLCGRPDIIKEEGSEAGQPKGNNRRATFSAGDFKTKDSSQAKGDTQSVISEDFGAKTAYLEALAMKTAVSKPRSSSRSGSRGRSARSSAASDISSNSTKSHTEKWRDFLDKKRRASASASPSKVRPSNTSDASAAAETYAAKKVEEMMAIMASRSKSAPRSFRSGDERSDENTSRAVDTMIQDHTRSSDGVANRRDVYDVSKQNIAGGRAKTDSLVAAEQLASARVNAMMQALANDSAQMEEGEI